MLFGFAVSTFKTTSVRSKKRPDAWNDKHKNEKKKYLKN